MNKETLALILVMGIAGLVILLFVAGQQVYGHEFTYEGDCGNQWCLIWDIQHYLKHILEEEKKQTALLDHIDCIMNENMRYAREFLPVGLANCGGYPLNVTGVWNP